MREVLHDIVKHITVAPGIETAKITGSKTETLIEAIDGGKSVIIKASLKTPITDFEGEFGISRLAYLNGLVGHSNFKSANAQLSVTRKTRAGVETPDEIVFVDEQKQKWIYRLMNSDLVPSQPKFLGKNWLVQLEPSKSKIREFASFAGLVSSFESHFMAKTVDNELRFYMGDEDGANDKGFMIFEKPVTGSLDAGYQWPMDITLAILKLADEEAVKMSFMVGAMQISLESKFANWNYILPARKGR